jgi:uroporphyrinogen decarboxylase
MRSMSRRERLRAAIAREPVDRPPYAFWRQFPAADRSPAGLAQATLRFHDRYGSDFLTVVPPAGYAAQAWGCEEADTPGPDGARPCARCAVREPGDWRGIRALDPAAAPGYRDVIEALVRIGFDRRIGDAPVLVMLPSPLTVAARLGGGRLPLDLREWPGLVADALRAIAETHGRFAAICLAEGLAGVLHVVHLPEDHAGGAAAGAGAAEAADRAVLETVGARGGLRVVYGAGGAPVDRLLALPADIVGWAPAPGRPGLADARARTTAALLGGLEARVLLEAPPEAAVAAARQAVLATGGTGLVVGGAVLPETPDGTLAAVVRALGGTPRPILGLTR